MGKKRRATSIDGQQSQQQPQLTSNTTLKDLNHSTIEKCNDESQPSFMQFFWEFADHDTNVRTSSINDLIAYIESLSDATTQTERLQYTLRRLIRGLASSRDAARQGFSVALSVLLQSFPQVTLQETIDLLNDYLQIRPSMKSVEQRDYQFGQLFGIMAIVSSKRLELECENRAKYFPLLILKLIEISKWKKWIREVCYECILRILPKVTNEIFLEALMEPLSSVLQCQREDFEPEQLQLHLGVSHYVESAQLTENKVVAQIFSKKTTLLTLANLKLFSKAFKASSSCYPRIHSLWYGLFGALLSQDKGEDRDCFALFESVWKALVDDLLLDDEHTTHERKGLVLKLFEMIVTKVPASVLHGSILSHKLVTCLCNNALKPSNYLHAAAKHCFQVFASSLQAEFIHFLEHQILFPSKLARTLESIPVDSTKKDNEHPASLLEIEEERDFARELGKRVHHIRMWALDQLIHTVSQVILKQDEENEHSKRWQEPLEFLISLAFFQRNEAAPQKVVVAQSANETRNDYGADRIWNNDVKTHPISESFRDALMKRILVLLSSNIASEIPKTTLHFAFHIIHKKLLKLCKDRKKSSKCTLQCAGGESVAKNAFAQIPKVASLVEKAHSNSKSSTENAASRKAFHLLLMFLSIQLLDASLSDDAVVVLQDLERSSQDLFNEKGAKSSKVDVEAPDPVAVLIDILLSMLAQDSSAVRNVVMHAFQSVLQLVNRNSLESIAQVIKPIIRKTNDEEEIEEGESSEGEGEEDEEEDEEILLDSEEASKALWDDVASLDRDDMALAAIVRQVKDKSARKNETKILEQRQIHFQLRVLDLLQVYLTRGSKQSFMLLIIPPLLDQLQATERGIKHERVLHERIRTLFKLIQSRAKLFVSIDSALKEDKLLVTDTVEYIVTAMITQNASKPTINVCISLLVFLVRLAYSQPTSMECVEGVMVRAIENAFTRKHGRFPRRFFEEFIARHHTEAIQLLLPRFCKIFDAKESERPHIVDPFLQSEARRLLTILVRSKPLLREPANTTIFIDSSPCIRHVIVSSMDPEPESEGKLPMKAKRIKTIITLAREYLQTCIKLQSDSCSADLHERLQKDMQTVFKALAPFAAASKSPVLGKDLEKLMSLQSAL
uniref:Uncharacterized protein AlNc14C153G7572 n=1 Tax=Albugo laibachii Nc14 TaxID=890382 RepID=F0WM69_9STRA|nr:conserved hypothetical protein [Albugo laibachii Nc14]|eukprot:CCA22397.1 conserved hypothetical protein [Albugo laibachii Nc14]